MYQENSSLPFFSSFIDFITCESFPTHFVDEQFIDVLFSLSLYLLYRGMSLKNRNKDEDEYDEEEDSDDEEDRREETRQDISS